MLCAETGVSESSRYPEGFGGVQLAELLHSISDWQCAMDEGTPVPGFSEDNHPKIVPENSLRSSALRFLAFLFSSAH